MLRIAVLLCALPVAACLRPPHDLLGAACDGDAECAPLNCVAGTCQRGGGDDSDGGGSPNLLVNGSFENGLAGWEPQYDSTLSAQPQPVRSGHTSLRVSAEGSSTRSLGFALPRTVLTPVMENATYCAEAWIHRGSITEHFTLVVRRYASADVFEDSARNPGSTVTPTSDEWTRVVDRIATRPGDAAVNLRVYTGWVEGSYFHADDVRIWEDPSGACAPAG